MPSRSPARTHQTLFEDDYLVRSLGAIATNPDTALTRSLLREDRRLLINALKIAACNAEKLLVRRFNDVYDQPKDAFSVFRSLLHLPGTVHAVTSDQLQVSLQRPDSEKVAHALDFLLTEINAEAPRMLGDGPRLNFSLEPLT